MDRGMDVSVLKGAAIVFLISLLFSGGLVWSGWYFKDEMLNAYNRAKAQQKSVASSYVSIDEEKRLVREYLPVFKNLHMFGVFGQEHRLNWLETLRSTGEKLKLPALRYEIDSQDIYVPDYTVNSGTFKIYASPMILNVELVHEIDLLDLLDNLDRKAQGIYNLKSCELIRSPKEASREKLDSYVNADCKLMWFNIKKSDGNTIDI